MGKREQHSGFQRWALRAAWLFGFLLVFGLLLRLSLKTKIVQRWVKNYAVSTVNQQLNAELSIDRLSGDLWKEVKASGISLVQKDTVAQIDSIRVSYNIWAIVSGRLELSDLNIYNPQAKLRQKQGQWNVQTLLSEPDTTGGGIPFVIDNMILREGKISVWSDSLPVDSSFVINDLNLSSSLGFENDAFDVNLRDLSFQVEYTELEQPLRVQTSASVQKNKITLEKLIFATGNSMVQSSGYVNPADSTVRFDLSASPISWKDITSYARDFPVRKNARVDLALSGKPEQFELTLTMEAEGGESLKVNSRFQWKSSLVLQQLQATAGYLSLRELLSDTTLPSLRDLDFEFSGRVNMADYQQAQGDVKFSAKETTLSPYYVDAISGHGSINGQKASFKIMAQQHQQRVTAYLQAHQLWSDLPSLSATIHATNIDPAFWLQDTRYTGSISFQSKISAQGWFPRKSQWKYSLNMSRSRFMGHSIANLSAKGQLSGNGGEIEAHMKVRDGEIELLADLKEMKKVPEYHYSIRTLKLDVGSLSGIKDFETVINSKITGKGRGFDLASLQLNTSVSIDSSLVNNELIRNLSAQLSIHDSVARVDTAQLQSTIAEGSFSLRMNILNRFDPNNDLSFDLHLRDLDALAPLAGVKDLQAEGQVKGELTPTEDEKLQFLGTIDLSDIKYDSLFMAERARGSLEMRLQKQLAYFADLDLSAPSFTGVQLQDLKLVTKGNYADFLAHGDYEFQFSSPNEGHIEQSGSYSLAKDSIRVRTTVFNIVSDYRTLSLEKPFVTRFKNDTLRMDTLRVSSGDDAYLEIAAPLVSKKEQHGFVRGKSLNTAVIQDCLLGKAYFKGLLSGQFEIARNDTDLDARGELILSEMEYMKTSFDSLHMAGKIQKERLKGTLSVRHEGKQLIDGEADLPFKLGDPKNLPSSFFEEPVSGTIRVRDIAIERFDSLFAEAGLAETSGILSMRGRLDGRAGEPQFAANASLRNAKLSGVSVDSVTAGVDYNHEDSELQLKASVMSLRQKAAQIGARFPLFVDMKTFSIDLPQAKDSVEVNVETNNFELKALNDFLNRRTIRQVTGRLDGLVQVRGPLNDLETDGKLTLRKGAFQIVPAGIKVDKIRSTLYFDHNQLRLTSFSAKSGKGDLNASGKLALEKLVPGNLDLKVEAQNFRAANTSQYNAVVNVDAQAKGSLAKPKVTGSINFISGFLKLQNFGEKSVETIELDSLEEKGPDVSIYDSLALDMDLNFNRRFYIRNKKYLEMEIELAGELDLLKESGGELQVFGTINTSNGYARPFGKEFKLEEGNIAFSGPPQNPQLMVRTRFEPPQTQENIVIWYIIEGTVENPKFKYESQPPMEFENIISYTLFGQPFYALDSWKQVVASSGSNTTASDVALDVLLDRVEALATQKLGIDVVKIDNSRVGGETGTSITTGWYLNPKVFFAIQNVITGSTPDTGFLLEYMLSKNLKLIIRQGNANRQGVDLKWNYDY